MYLIEGLANGRIAVLGKIHHALADGVASANLLARGMDLHDSARRRNATPTPPTPPVQGRAGALGVHRPPPPDRDGSRPWCATPRRACAGCGRSPHKLSPELTRPFTPPPTFMNHVVDATRRFATATLALADVKQTGKHLGVTINDMVLAIVVRCAAQAVAALRRQRRPSAAGLGAGQLRLLAGPHLRQLLHRGADRASGGHRRSAGAGPRRARRGRIGQGEQQPDRPGTGESLVGVLRRRPPPRRCSGGCRTRTARTR